MILTGAKVTPHVFPGYILGLQIQTDMDWYDDNLPIKKLLQNYMLPSETKKKK